MVIFFNSSKETPLNSIFLPSGFNATEPCSSNFFIFSSKLPTISRALSILSFKRFLIISGGKTVAHQRINPTNNDLLPLYISLTRLVLIFGLMRTQAFTKNFPITPIATPEGLINPAAVSNICLHCPVTNSSSKTISVKEISLCPENARLRRKESRSMIKKYRMGRFGIGTGIGIPDGVGTYISVSAFIKAVTGANVPCFILLQNSSISAVFLIKVSNNKSKDTSSPVRFET